MKCVLQCVTLLCDSFRLDLFSFLGMNSNFLTNNIGIFENVVTLPCYWLLFKMRNGNSLLVLRCSSIAGYSPEKCVLIQAYI